LTAGYCKEILIKYDLPRSDEKGTAIQKHEQFVESNNCKPQNNQFVSKSTWVQHSNIAISKSFCKLNL